MGVKLRKLVSVTTTQHSFPSNSAQSPTFLAEETLVEEVDEPVYNAVTMDTATTDERRKHRIKLGQCPSCVHTSARGVIKEIRM